MLWLWSLVARLHPRCGGAREGAAEELVVFWCWWWWSGASLLWEGIGFLGRSPGKEAGGACCGSWSSVMGSGRGFCGDVVYASDPVLRMLGSASPADALSSSRSSFSELVDIAVLQRVRARGSSAPGLLFFGMQFFLRRRWRSSCDAAAAEALKTTSCFSCLRVCSVGPGSWPVSFLYFVYLYGVVLCILNV